MSVLSDIETRRIRDETIREVIRHLMQNARDPERIGRRVLAWDFKLREGEQREKLLTFAKTLGVSSARASTAVSEAEADLFEVRNVKSVRTDQASLGNCPHL
jgi:uncharacterized protein YigA (DUF484 family)